jgi:cation-transporting ATPase 13A2
MSTSPEPPYDYAEGASTVEIDEALSGTQPIPTGSRTRRDSQVGSAYGGDNGEASASGAIFDGYGAYAIPSSVTSMHHDRVITWSHDSRRSITSTRRPHVRRRTDASASSSRISRRDSGEREQDINDALFASDDELEGVSAASDDEDGRPSIRSRSSLKQRSMSRHSRKLSEPVGRNVFGSLAGIFSRQSLDSPSRPDLSTHRSSVSDTSRRRARSRRTGSDASIASSAGSAHEDVSDEEMWGYSSGEEDIASPDEASSSVTPSYVGEDDSLYTPSEGDIGARSPTTSLPILAGAGDPIFGDTRIEMGEVLGYQEFSIQPIGGPPSRQRVHLEDEDMTVLFVGCQVITWRKWAWRIATVCTFGLLGLAGLWVPTLWLKWVTRECAFEKLGQDGSGESLVVVEVSVIAKLGL